MAAVLGAGVVLLSLVLAPGPAPTAGASTARHFGSYRGSPESSAWVAKMRARYGGLSIVTPAWDARQRPSAAEVSAVRAAGIYASIEVCDHASDWATNPHDRRSWSAAKGAACVARRAATLGAATVRAVQAVMDGHELDEWSTPAQQVFMYSTIKHAFPGADVVSYHAGELTNDRLPGWAYGSAGRSCDVVHLGSAQGTAYLLKAVQQVRGAEGRTGAVKIVVSKNARGPDALTVPMVAKLFANLRQLDAIHPIFGYEVRTLDQLDATKEDPVASALRAAVRSWLG